VAVCLIKNIQRRRETMTDIFSLVNTLVTKFL